MMAVWKNTLDVKRKYNNYLSIGEKKQVGIRIEGDLVDLEPELLLVNDLLALDVDERDQVLLIAHGDRFAVLRPGDTLSFVCFYTVQVFFVYFVLFYPLRNIKSRDSN